MLVRLAFLLLLGLLVIACGGGGDGGASGDPAATSGPTSTNTSVLAEPVEAATAAIEAMAASAGRTVEEIEVLSVTPMEWPDACLGLPEAGEACAQVITLGYEVTLSLDDNVSVYHTDENSNVRLADEAAP